MPHFCLIFAAESATQNEVNGRAPHYLRSSKNPTARRQRDFTSESANGSYHSEDVCVNNPIQRSQQYLPPYFQKRLENESRLARRFKRKFSDANEGESEPFSASRLAGCRKLPAHKCFSTRTCIPKRPRLFVSSNSQVTDVSSILQDDGKCSGMIIAHSTYQSSAFPQRTASQEQVSCQVLDPIIQPALQDEIAQAIRDHPTQQQISGEAYDNRKYPFESRSSNAVGLLATETDSGAPEIPINSRTSARVIFNSKSRVDPDVLSKTGTETFESSNASDLEAGEAPGSQFGVDGIFPAEHGSGPSVFQFPYKKRPHNWSPFFAVASPRCFDQPLTIEYAHPGYLMDLTDQNELPCFKPLYYLQQLLTPQQVEHITAQNPGTE